MSNSIRNTQGTLNYQPRVHKFQVSLTLKPSATAANPSGPNVQLNYLDTIRFSGPDGTPVTGLDPDVFGSLSYPGFPNLPAATYQGDGFGGSGPGGKRISLDSEGLVVNSDGSFWVSDEYGPYVYKFDATGKMVTAIRPPEAYIPRRNGTERYLLLLFLSAIFLVSNYAAASQPIPRLTMTPIRPSHQKTIPLADRTIKASRV